ncbi:MAG TPA: uroporphyrinogen decarboxylase family protein [Thermodesulfobacteriota bacterium]|nr:uroporphyrinogen decarboxylase family protein [Thermodesulfobacteriota bacterium]
MNKIERVQAALTGAPVDRAPFTVWYHFGTQHASPEQTAEVHLAFFEAYDLDFLKVMNDYDYPMPDGMETMATAADLKRLSVFDVAASPLGNQLKALEIIAKRLKGKALFVDTLFTAWNTIRRNLVKEALPGLMADHPRELLDALNIINQNLIRYALASLERGSAGIFFSVPASAEFVTPEQYEKFMRPFDLEFLNAVRGKGEMHILHAHGEKLFFDRLLDYPVRVISWADLNGGPTIAEARRKTPLALMAGIDHVKFANVSAGVIRGHVRGAMAQGGNTKFILAPGCSLPTFSYPPMIRAARDAARGR